MGTLGSYNLSGAGGVNATLASPAAGRFAVQKAPQQLGFLLVFAYVFLAFSRVQDFAPGLRIPAVLLGLGGLAAVLSGSALAGINSKIGACMVVLTTCMLMSIPLSVWPGGAARYILSRWVSMAVLFCLIPALINTPKQLSQMLAGILVGIVILVFVSLFQSQEKLGRLEFEVARFGDPNEVAQVLLVGMCMLLTIPRKSRGRTFLLCCIGALFFVRFMQTGSRGGLIALFVTLASVVLLGKARMKFPILAAGVAVVLGAIALAPSTLRSRYLYVFGMSDYNLVDARDIAAGESAVGRTQLLVRSIEMTIRHPLFGVGTGMFQVAENSAAVDQGMRKGMWHDTHNMFTEVSSENGILAGLAFLAMFVIALRRLSLVYRRYRDAKDPQGASLAGMAFGLRTAVIAFMVSGFFLSCAYTELTVVLVALTVVVDRKAAAFTEGSPAVSRFMESPVAVPARVRVAAQVSPNRAEQPVPSGSLYRLRGLRRPNPPAGRM